MIDNSVFIKKDGWDLDLSISLLDTTKKRKRDEEIPSDVLAKTLPSASSFVPKRRKIQKAIVLKKDASSSYFSSRSRISRSLKKKKIVKQTGAKVGPSLPLSVPALFKKLREEKPEGWQQKAVKLIRQNRNEEDLDAEFERLKLMGFSEKHASLLEQAVQESNYKGDDEANLKAKASLAKVLIAQAFAIKEVYAETHDVFIHAQKTSWTVIPHLIKELIKKFDPQKDVHNFKFLRLPESYVRNAEKSPEAVWDFVETQEEIHDHDPKTKELLLSADAYFCSSEFYESALDLLVRNVSIEDSHELIDNLAKKIIGCFCPKITAKDEERLLKELRVASELYEKTLADSCGNLFVICIPKEKSGQMQYRSHPFGVPCECFSEDRDREILDRLNREEHGKDIVCPDISVDVPQYRLYTPLLTPEVGVRSYLLTLAPKKVRTLLKTAIKKVVNEVHAIQQSR